MSMNKNVCKLDLFAIKFPSTLWMVFLFFDVKRDHMWTEDRGNPLQMENQGKGS